MDELINKVAEKAGISADQAKNAVSSVIDFLKAKIPGIGEQLAAMMGSGSGGAGGASSVIDSVRGKLGI